MAVVRIAFFFFTCLHVSIAQDSPAVWPKEITTDQGQIVVYQPQPSNLDGSKLTGTAAFSILPQGKNDPLFGALFFSAMLDFDRDNHLYTLRSCDVTNVRFASQDSTIDMEKVKAGIVSAIPTCSIFLHTDHFCDAAWTFQPDMVSFKLRRVVSNPQFYLDNSIYPKLLLCANRCLNGQQIGLMFGVVPYGRVPFTVANSRCGL